MDKIIAARMKFDRLCVADATHLTHESRKRLVDLSRRFGYPAYLIAFDVPPDDIYAAFAGWHAQHEEIYEIDMVDLNDAQRVESARLERRLRDAGYDAIRALQLGSFLGDRMLVARAVLEGLPGIAVADSNEIQWHPGDRQRPIGADEACCIYKGRKLLRAFNP